MDEGAVRSELVWRMGKMDSVVLLLVLALICPSQLEIAHAKDVSSIDRIDRRADQEIPDPCKDPSLPPALRDLCTDLESLGRDRKSTRLNSSHRCISYAVFCLK